MTWRNLQKLPIWTPAEMRKVCGSLWPTVTLQCASERYRAVTLPEIERADWSTRGRWTPVRWDCSWQGLALIAELGKRRARVEREPASPAAFMLSANRAEDGALHRFVGFRQPDGTLALFDPSLGRQVPFGAVHTPRKLWDK